MKAITLWQPWASLLACGVKKYETRSWPTSYRGPIAIHAAARHPNWFKRDTYECTELEEMLVKLWGAWGWNSYDELPRGKVIAKAELVNCWHIVTNPGTNIDVAKHIPIGAESMTNNKHDPDFADYFVPTEQEMIFGDWTPGRYAWEFANMTMLPEPITAKGSQGFWNWPGGTE